MQRRKVSATLRENESTEDAYERRLKESQKVEERVEVVFSESEVVKALEEVRPPAISCKVGLCIGSESAAYHVAVVFLTTPHHRLFRHHRGTQCYVLADSGRVLRRRSTSLLC